MFRLARYLNFPSYAWSQRREIGGTCCDGTTFATGAPPAASMPARMSAALRTTIERCGGREDNALRHERAASRRKIVLKVLFGARPSLRVRGAGGVG